MTFDVAGVLSISSEAIVVDIERRILNSSDSQHSIVRDFHLDPGSFVVIFQFFGSAFELLPRWVVVGVPVVLCVLVAVTAFMVVRRQRKAEGEWECKLCGDFDANVAVRYGRLYLYGETLTDDTDYYSSDVFVNDDKILRDASALYASSDTHSDGEGSDTSEVELSSVRVVPLPSLPDGPHPPFEALVRPQDLQLPPPLSDHMQRQPPRLKKRVSPMKSESSTQPEVHQWKNIAGPTPNTDNQPADCQMSVERQSRRGAQCDESASWGEAPLSERSPETKEWF